MGHLAINQDNCVNNAIGLLVCGGLWVPKYHSVTSRRSSGVMRNRIVVSWRWIYAATLWSSISTEPCPCAENFCMTPGNPALAEERGMRHVSVCWQSTAASKIVLFLFPFSFAAVATRIATAATATVSSAMFVSGTRNFDTRRNWCEKLALKNRYHFMVPVFGTGFWYVCHGP